LLERGGARVERDDLGDSGTARGYGVEALRVLAVTGQDLVTLSGVHVGDIGLAESLL
jgi:hypothetical protein